MSTISSGTTLTTALVQTGDTTGDLVIKTGSSNTTAMTVSGSNQSVTFAGAVNVASSAFANGSASAPSITFTGDTNTGIFSPAADTIAFAEGGVESMRINNVGYLGIGTTSPGFPLDVQCDAGAFGLRLRGRSDNISVLRFVSNDAATTYGQFDVRSGEFIVNAVANIPMVFNTNNTERMRIDSSGNVQLSTANTSILNSSGRPILNQTGSVLQVVSTAKTDTFSTASNTMTAVTGLSATITPSSTSSKILVLITMSVGTNYSGTSIMTGIRRNGTDIIFGQAAGSRKTAFMTDTGSNSNFQLSISMSFLDSPSSTSALTYAAAMGCQEGNSTTVFVNRSGNDPDSGFASRTASTITVMEIAG